MTVGVLVAVSNKVMLAAMRFWEAGTGRNARLLVAMATAGAGVGIWLLTRRYMGLNGDARLYAFMADARIHPQIFASDLFLRFGSQDPYSLFSPLYAFLIGRLGLTTAGMVLILAIHALWLVGAWMLTHRLARGVAGHAAFILTAAISAVYGGWAALFAGEAALTARPLAEALVMIALALALSRAWISAVAALILAALVHPAMALAGVTAAFVMLALRRPRLWLIAPVAAVIVLGFAAANVEPFARILTVMDGPWLAAVVGHNGFVLTGLWLEGDWVRVVADLSICVAAAVWSAGARRRFFIAVSATAVAGLAVAAIGGDLLHDALVIQLQTWRFAWLLALAALPGIVVVALRLRRRPAGWPAIALLAAPLIAATRVFSDFTWAWIGALILSLAGLALAWLIRRGRAPKLSRAAARITVEIAAVLPLAAVVDSLILFAQDLAFGARHGGFAQDPTSFIGVRLVLLVAGIAVVLLAVRRPAIALSAAPVAILAAALVWDARSPWDRYVEAGAPGPVAAALPASGAILWGDEAAPTWFLLGRPAYVSATQATGLLFSRATAMEWTRRAAIVAPLVPLKAWSPDSKLPTCAERTAPVAAQTLTDVCAKAPDLAAIVLDRPAVGVPALAFTTPVTESFACMKARHKLDTRQTRSFLLVRCDALRTPGRVQ